MEGHLKRLGALARDEDGQNLVEFALLLPVLLYILMGIIQFGFIFAAYLTLNNAVREAARWGSIYVYDSTITKTANDTARNNGMVDHIVGSRGVLNIPSRGTNGTNINLSGGGTLTSADCPTAGGSTYSAGSYYGASAANADVGICYTLPTGVSESDARRGEYIDIQAWYHLQVFIPLLDQFLPSDPVKGAQWFRLPGRISVVVN